MGMESHRKLRDKDFSIGVTLTSWLSMSYFILKKKKKKGEGGGGEEGGEGEESCWFGSLVFKQG